MSNKHSKNYYFGVWQQQQERNQNLLSSPYLGKEISSHILPFHLDIQEKKTLSHNDVVTLEALQIESAEIAIRSLNSLSKINEVDHLGGGLDLISSLMVTLSVTDYDAIEYSIEHAHTSIGYYSCLAALGFLKKKDVIERFRRGIEITGHVSWIPGGTQISGGRLGVVVPVAVGQSLAKKAIDGDRSWVLVHCGDAGWISGQALNGFNSASFHQAPITFIMHRNGVQLSGTTKQIMDIDPRPIIASLGIEIVEIPSLEDIRSLYAAYVEAYSLAQEGKPSLIYPTGIGNAEGESVTLSDFARSSGIVSEVKEFSQKHKVAMDTAVWIPGSLMSFRDLEPMLESIFLVNGLSGGKCHHDGHMKGRSLDQVLANPLMQKTAEHQDALTVLRNRPLKNIITSARPSPGSPNLIIPNEEISSIDLPAVGEKATARIGSEAGYAAVAKHHPDNVFIIGCDLDSSTRLAKAKTFLPKTHQFELSIEEQVAALMTNGFAFHKQYPQLNVFSTFAAFFEGIAREGFEFWRYQRNLNGINEGLNATFHLSHVGSCTGRDHFSGWGLDWVTLSLGYLPYLHRFYAPADARSAFLAVKDLAAHVGGHIIGIPRDTLPILAASDGSPLWNTSDTWEPLTTYRTYPQAKRAILAFGAPAYLASEATEVLQDMGIETDAYIVNGLPLSSDVLCSLFTRYPDGIVTIEDGIIATREFGLRGFAGMICSAAHPFNIPLEHIGIIDPRVAPSEGHHQTWEHFGITTENIVAAIQALSQT